MCSFAVPNYITNEQCAQLYVANTGFRSLNFSTVFKLL